MTARRVNGMTYLEWRDQYYATNNVTLPMDLEAKRQQLFNAVPNGFLPPTDGLRWKAFIDMDRGADKRVGQVYLPDAATGRVAVDEYVQLAFDEFQEVCVRRARLAADDLANIREMAAEWADAHPQARLDVDTFMDDVKQAAGL